MPLISNLVKVASLLMLSPALLTAATVTKLPHPQYPIYSVCALNFTLEAGAQTQLFANSFSLAHGGFQSTEIAAVKAVNPNCILVNYMNSTYTNSASEVAQAEAVKAGICMTQAGQLRSSIGKLTTSFHVNALGTSAIPILATHDTNNNGQSDSTTDFVFWIGINGELMLVTGFNVTTATVTVQRGYAGTVATSHAANEFICSPQYVGNFPNSTATYLRYCLDPDYQAASDIKVSQINSRISPITGGFDGAWIDTCNQGTFNLCDALGQSCRPWQWKPKPTVDYTQLQFRDAQNRKMKYFQDQVQIANPGKPPVIIANNLSEKDILGLTDPTDPYLGMTKLLMSDPDKPVPIDGFCNESWGENAMTTKNIVGQITAIRRANAMGLATLPIISNAGSFSATDIEARANRSVLEEHAYACYLLAVLPDQANRPMKFGTYAFYNNNGTRTVQLNDQYLWPLGLPLDTWNASNYGSLSAYETTGTPQVYLRKFTNGVVVINGTSSSATVALGGSYMDPKTGVTGITSVTLDGLPADPVTVAPTVVTAKIFLKPPGFSQYQVLNFTPTEQNNPAVSGPNADPDGDGVPNLCEYATGKDARVAHTSDAPVVTQNAGHLTLTYTQLKAAVDVTYQPEVSADLVTWNSGASFLTTNSTTDNGDGVTQTVVVSDTTLISSSNKRFIRLKVIGASN
jgi:hypothetical protein